MTIFLYYSCREVNKQLRDENDSLRAIIESNKSNATPTKVNIKKCCFGFC